MMETVFPFGRPAGPDDIVDRDAFMEEVCQRLSDGHSVMLSSPRRTGKSSVAGEILRRMEARNAYTASVDLFHVANVEELGLKLLQAVLENRTGALRRAGRAFAGMREWLSGAEVRARLQDLELGIKLSGPQPGAQEMLETAIETAETLAKRDRRRMVVLLDEFQEVEHLGGEGLLKRMRSQFQAQRETVYLFLGSQTTLMRTMFADRRHAFYRFALPLDLPHVPAEDWQEYIERRFVGLGMTCSPSALSELLRRTGGHPYCVMAVAYHTYLHAKLMGVQGVTAESVAVAYEETLGHMGEFYAVHWAEIRRIHHADAVLRTLVGGGRPYSLPQHSAAITQALRHLMRISVIQKGRARGEYHLVEPMFGDWIRRHE